MENQEGNKVPRSASLSTNNDDPKTPMSEQNVRDRGLDDLRNADGVAMGHEGNSSTPMSLVASQEPEGSDGKQFAKRKRGRPTKSDEVNGHMVLHASSVGNGVQTSPPLANPVKRSRGRPRGTRRLQLLTSSGGIVAESAGRSFNTHVICVNPGDDVVNTIKQFSWGPRSVVILSAAGSISSVSIRAAGGVLQFKGNFEITNLSGSFVYGGISDLNNKVGLLSIIFANPDGNLYGGQVESTMIAATPIRIIAGSFKQRVCNVLRRKYPSESSAAVKGLDESNPRAKMREGEENCVAPKSPLLSRTLGGCAITEMQHSELSSSQAFSQEMPLPVHPALQQITPPENLVENGV